MNNLFPARGAPATIAKQAAPVIEQKAAEINPGRVPALSYGVEQFFNITQEGEYNYRLTPKSAIWRDGLVFTCMEFRGNKTAEPPLLIADMVENNLQWLQQGHPLDAVLEEPNPDMDMATFLMCVSMLLDVDAELLLVKTRAKAGYTKYLYPFPKSSYMVEPANGLIYGKFTVSMMGGTRKVFAPEDVIYLREPSAGDYGATHSRVEAAMSKIGMGADLIRAVKATLRRGVRPSGILTTKQTMTAQQLRSAQENINEEYAGVNQDGGVLIVSGEGASFTQLGSSLKDLTTGPAQLDYEAAVCQVFQVHPVLIQAKIGLENNTGLADSIRPAQDLYYDVAQRPRWTRIASALTRGLLRELEPDNRERFIRFDTSDVEALKADIPTRVTTASAAREYWKVNEARVYTGMKPLPEDDERGEMFISEASPAAFGAGLFGDDAGEPEDDEVDDDIEDDEDEEKQRKRARRSVDVAARHILRISRRAIADAYEFTIQNAASRALSTDLAAIKRIIRGDVKADEPIARPITKLEADAASKRVKRYIEKESGQHWQQAIAEPIQSVSTASVRQLIGELGLSFEVLQPGLEKYVKKEVGHLIKEISSTTLANVQDQLAAGLADGRSIDQLTDALGESGTFAPSRARLIARTESTRATNGAQRSSLSEYQKTSGNKVRKEWLTAGDDDVREEHKKLEAERRDIDEPFSNELMEPGEPNCRCSLLYSLEAA